MPLMATGFADSTTDYRQPYTFQDDGVVLIEIIDGEALLKTVSLSVDGTPGTGPIDVSLDGENYTLERGPTVNKFSSSSPDASVYAGLINAASTTGLYYISRDTDEAYLGAYDIIGYDTDPADIARIPGSATYFGEAEITLRNNENAGFGTGPIKLDIDFERSSISVDITVTDYQQQGTTLNFPTITIELNEGAITGNGFSGTTQAQTAFLGDTFSVGTYSGRFYEDGGAVAAGKFSGTVDAPGIQNTLPYEGAFLATE